MAPRRVRSALRRLARSRFSSAFTAGARRAEAGFTLVEVVVSTFLLTVSLVGLAQLFAVSVQMHQLSRNSEIATQLAEAKFEQLMKLNFTAAAAVQVTGSDSLSSNVANYFDTPSAEYTRRWRVETGPIDRTRRVTVRMVPRVTNNLLYRPVQLTTLIRQW